MSNKPCDWPKPRGSIQVRSILFLVFACGVASADPLVGKWRVTGCETSPRDPAPCATGHITFSADQVTIDVPAEEDRKARSYTVVSAAADRVVVKIDGKTSEITFANGVAMWHPPGVNSGRVHRISFVREH